MSIISSVSHARKTWLATATTTVMIVTLSSIVGVLTTPLFAFLTAAACTLVAAAGVALRRAARTMDTIFTEELDDPRQRQPTRLKRAK
ncbi:hypothetical protein ACFFQW_37290 [Umezawaea endophytica]|uniref:Uncharacterized protein n=1 Tax=Umezawaea endophytica TaxID=1654476 RepID=A0A9X2VWL3_9PSEU|nr:hypothetical protein [Umezawaea endophytica]MCS7483399.1 hypothetical protein [Umezawaea endophytica]